MATINVRLLDMQGQPFAKSFLSSLYHADLHFEPARRRSTILADGSVDLEIEGTGRSLHARLLVPEFGNVWVLADKCGQGYSSQDKQVDFVREAAQSMLYHARKVMASDVHSPECSGHAAAA
ncbi:MAG: hypothetical protein ACYC6L_09810 [Anaerolineae bacterium]